MIRLYAQTQEGCPCVRIGRTLANIDRALEKAKALRALQVEVRNDSLPRAKSLLAVFREGVQVAL